METKDAVSAGGVIFRKSHERLEVTLIARKSRSVWCLPKGAVELNESLEDAAMREVFEETGLKGEMIQKIGQIDYWFYWQPDEVRYHKFVHFYLLKYLEGDTENHDHEVDEARWFPIDEAVKKLTFETERGIVEKARAILKKR